MTKKDSREEFSPGVKRIIAHRAGFRCSYPDCYKTLVGPGRNNDEYIVIGEYSHIFSASTDGPRGNGGLNENQLKRPENGIFLCRNHHKIVDTKRGNKYPSEVLIRFKSRHEFLISAEIGEYLYPLNWINSFRIKQSSLFKKELSLNFGKLTHFYGDFGSGKTTICELIYSCFQQKIDNRWNNEDDHFLFEISMDNPVIKKFDIEIEDKLLTYLVDENRQSFVPFEFFVIYLKNELRNEKDDLNEVSKCFNLDRNFLKSFILNNGIKDGITTKEYSIKNIRKKPYFVDELFINVGNRRQQSFSSCSSSEQGRVLLDIAISLATNISRIKSVLLIIDWVNIGTLDDNWFNSYLNFLVSSKAHFQTIFVSPYEMNTLNWIG